MTGKRIWKMILFIPLLVGCHDQKKDIMVITQEEVTVLLEQHFSSECTATNTDMVAGLSFNTLTRVPGKTAEDKWTTLPDRDIITLPDDAAETKKHQISYLVKQGILEKISDNIYLGRGAIRGYYHKPVDYLKGEQKGEWTFEDKGTQYRLTQKGNTKINQKSRPALAFCIGTMSINQPIVYRQPETYPDKVKVVFTTSLGQTPEWIIQPETRNAFPYVIQQWKRKKVPVRYKTYIKILNGQYVIENDQFTRLD